MLHDPKCRFDCPLAPVRLHHADIFFKPSGSLDWLSSDPPINTKLKTTFKGSNTKTKSLPRSNLFFLAPSLLSPHSPHISYDRRSLSNAPEHRPKSTTYTTTKRPCSSGREPNGRDKFLSRPQSFG
ncbi:unnamed protein product [Prunus brigantina]